MFWLAFQPSNIMLLLLILFKAYRVSEPFYCALCFLAVHFPHLNVLEVLCMFIRTNVWLFVVALKRKDIPSEVLSTLRFYFAVIAIYLVADCTSACRLLFLMCSLAFLAFTEHAFDYLITFQPLLQCWRCTWKQNSSCPLPLFLFFETGFLSPFLLSFPLPTTFQTPTPHTVFPGIFLYRPCWP